MVSPLHPPPLPADTIQAYLDAGHWTTATMAARTDSYADTHPDRLACQDHHDSLTWAELRALTDRLAAHLVALGIGREARAVVQMPSSAQEMVLRLAFKKAGIVGAFVPMQWRRRELAYVLDRVRPDLVAVAPEALAVGETDWPDLAAHADIGHRVSLGPSAPDGWSPWPALADARTGEPPADDLAGRAFRFDEVSVITVSSGTSGPAKLCAWPEAAQVCAGRAIAGRLGMTADDNVGIFAPMSGAAGVLVWSALATAPATFTFPAGYRAPDLLNAVDSHGITVATTVPVILARLAAIDLAEYDLNSLRALRVGTAAADMSAARAFEVGADCRVVIASGSMECPGFGHADIAEPASVRLDGSVGLPLPGCRLRIVDENGAAMPPGEAGELKVSAPFAATGYWADPAATAAAWSDGWYATGDIGRLDANGRLTLLGRMKETINRSGLKILPNEVEHEIARHPDVFACAVVAAPDTEYGEVPWAFVQPHAGHAVDPEALGALLTNRGLAAYKVPVRFIVVDELPRVGGNKIDKSALRDKMSPV